MLSVPVKIWFHSKSGKAPGANNGTSQANAWNSKYLWSVARKFIRFIPLFLFMGCQGLVPVAVGPKEINPMTVTVPAVVLPRQPMGYEVNYAEGMLVVIINGPNKGSQCFFGTSHTPVWIPLHCSKAASITVQGSNNLQSWNDLLTTNAPDFYFKFDPKYLFYRTKS
jgi:hypothetical protein